MFSSIGDDITLIDTHYQPEPDQEELNAEVEGLKRLA